MFKKIIWKVVNWKALWRTLWFATANVEIPLNSHFFKGGMGGLTPWTYKINIIIDWKKYAWVWAYLEKSSVFEAHIFDFSKDIYGQIVEVYILSKIRDNKKFSSLDELKSQIEKDKEFAIKSKDIALTFWTFDVFHEWHKYFLQEAKNFSDLLITIIATDKNVQKIKWFKTHFDENTRKNEVLNSKIPDEVYVWSETDPMNWLLKFKPKVICLWYDQRWFSDKLEDFIKEHNLDTQIIRIESHKPEIYKSSILKKELEKNKK